MKFRITASIYFLSAFVAGLLLIQYPNYGTSTIAQTAENTSKQNEEKIEPNVERLKQHDVIYLGENHDLPQHHAAQLAIITQLLKSPADSSTQLAIGLEMFQRPFQPILDRYLAREITEAELRKQTEYDTRWGFDWEFYAPILRFAQAHQIPLIALNTPGEITQKVAKTGLDSLSGKDFRHIPPREEIKLDNPAYRQQMTEIYQGHVQAGQGNSSDLENFYAAQVLWDETMADAIASFYQNNPQSQMVVLVGKAHVMKDYAIPNRVSRRITDKYFSQTSFLL